jgi:hypothetical protein
MFVSPSVIATLKICSLNVDWMSTDRDIVHVMHATPALRGTERGSPV